MQIPACDFRARAGKQAVGKRGVDIIRATGTRGLLVINFNRISARAIVTSLSMADINRARAFPTLGYIITAIASLPRL